jgi:hypothetical protein
MESLTFRERLALRKIRGHLVALGLPEAAGWTDEETAQKVAELHENMGKAARSIGISAAEAAANMRAAARAYSSQFLSAFDQGPPNIQEQNP